MICIGGGSASGKTTVAEALKARIEALGHTVVLIKMDNYFCEVPAHVTDIAAYRRDTNFDHLGAYDMALLASDIELLKSGKPIRQPIFDFPTNKRLSFVDVAPGDFLIIEGLFALYFAKNYLAVDDKLTVSVSQTSYLSLVKTRAQRDKKERGFLENVTYRKERKFVGPGFFDNIAPAKLGVDIDITNDPVEATDAAPVMSPGILVGIEEIIAALGLLTVAAAARYGAK